MTWKELRVPAVIVVGCVWTLSFLDGLYTQSFIALGITTPVVMLAAGALFTIRNGRNNNNSEGSE